MFQPNGPEGEQSNRQLGEGTTVFSPFLDDSVEEGQSVQQLFECHWILATTEELVVRDRVSQV